jgi:hypothetical protein
MWNALHNVANLFIKESSLFLLFATLRFPKQSPPPHALGMIKKLSMSRGAPRCFGKVHFYGARVLNNFVKENSTKSKQIFLEKFR